MAVSDTGRRSIGKTYSFYISRDFPKIWADRSDIVFIASLVLAIVFFLTKQAMSGLAPSLFDSTYNINPRDLTTIFWILGSVACIASTGFWMSLKSQSIRIDHAPSLSRISSLIRFSVYILLLSGPFAYFYADLSAQIKDVYIQRGTISSDSFDLEFFSDENPWLSWVTLSVLLAILVFSVTAFRFGVSMAMGAMIATLVWYGIMATAGAMFSSMVINDSSNLALGRTFSGCLVFLLVIGILVPGKLSWIRVCLCIPALYTATFGPWIVVVLLFYSRSNLLTFPNTLSTVLALYAVVLVNGLILAVLGKRLLR